MFRHLKIGTTGSAVFLLASVALALPCEAAPPGDPVGIWKLRCVAPDGKARACVVAIRREGEALKGIYTTDGQTREAKEVVFAQGVLSIRVDGQFAGQVYGLTYSGKPAGDALRGTVRWSYGIARGSFAFEGERIGQDVAAAP
jgi:hypothetical protein